MAAFGAHGQSQVGSSGWVQNENRQVSLFCAQEAEDFAFSARNEVEWLNEHMAEILNKDKVNVADIFKTPGKLRGKTPRTVRKRNPAEAREPLSDIFSANVQTMPLSARRTSPIKCASPPKIAAFKVAKDYPSAAGKLEDIRSDKDSGYHGLPEDEMDVDAPTVPSSAQTHDTLENFPQSPARNIVPMDPTVQDRSSGEGSFHTATADIPKSDVITGSMSNNEVGVSQDLVAQSTQIPNQPAEQVDAGPAAHIEILEKDVDEDLAADESRSSSQSSSPARTLVRKSSLTFAALPARQPITTKKSIGARASRTSHLDQTKASASQGSFLVRITGGKSLGGVKQPDIIPVQGDSETQTADRPQAHGEESDNDTKLHNKSSTQRLHDRIHMLGKSQPPRPTKSIPTAASAVEAPYPELQMQDPQKSEPQRSIQLNALSTNGQDHGDVSDDDDWIQPSHTQYQAQAAPLPTTHTCDRPNESTREKRTTGHEQSSYGQHDAWFAEWEQKSKARPTAARVMSASQFPMLETMGFKTAAETLETTEAFYPDLGKPENASTTPVGTPSGRRYVDGPLSASKSKLQSIMKTARGLFSSSAGVSAQAKMETMSPSLEPREDQVINNMPAPGRRAANAASSGPKDPKAAEGLNGAPGIRKTRSSTEKEQRMKAKDEEERRHVESENERSRGQVFTAQRQTQVTNISGETVQVQPKPTRTSPRKAGKSEHAKLQTKPSESEFGQQSMGPPANHTAGRPSQSHRLKDVRRPVKPAKDAAPKPKAPPVNIRVGMPSQRVPLTNAVLSSSLQDSLAPAQAKPPGVAKKASTASMQSSVSNSNAKSSTATSKPKALIAAERKKEQDAREAQRKLDQKREMERKRAVQQEDARRQEQLQREEAERQRERERAAAADDPKKIAQRQAIERRRLEMQKKDQRPPQALPAVHQQQAPLTTRLELNSARPQSRQQSVPEHHRPPTNASRAPIKRVFDAEPDEAPSRSTRPRGGPSYQQTNAKRRKTEDEQLEEFPIRPTMAPPIRQSTVRKDGPKASIFSINNLNPALPATSLSESSAAPRLSPRHLKVP
ncbi:MAG: hypothetical protein Q9163_005646 [Psora crenata]